MLLKTVLFLLVSMPMFALEVQGHRGNRGQFPENSLPAFASAIEAGVDVLELDLMETKDGIIIIHHDYYVNANLCTDMDGNPVNTTLIHDMTLEEIKQLDCGRKANAKFPEQQAMPGTTIPTLAELLDMIGEKGVRVNLEIKRDPRYPAMSGDPAVVAKKVVEIVNEKGFAGRVIYTSFDPESLAQIRKVDPEAKIGFAFGQISLDALHMKNIKDAMKILIYYAKEIGAESIAPDYRIIDGEDVATLHAEGFRVIPWTVNEPASWDKLIEMGVDGIITDYPSALIKYLGR